MRRQCKIRNKSTEYENSPTKDILTVPLKTKMKYPELIGHVVLAKGLNIVNGHRITQTKIRTNKSRCLNNYI